MPRSPAHRLVALMMVLAFLAGTGRSALGLHECLHHLGDTSGAAASTLAGGPASHAGEEGAGHHHGHGAANGGANQGAPSGAADHSGAGVAQDGHGDHGHGSHGPGPCTCFGSCACACAPSGPTGGSLVEQDSPPPSLPFLEEDADRVDPRLVPWDRPPATAPPSTSRVVAFS